MVNWQPPSPTYYYEGVGYYRLLVVDGSFGDPPPDGVADTDYEVVSLLPNMILTQKRLCVVADSQFWVEDV